MPFKSLSNYRHRNKLNLTKNKNDKSFNVNCPYLLKKIVRMVRFSERIGSIFVSGILNVKYQVTRGHDERVY